MKPDSKLAGKINSQDFIVTAEYLPAAAADMSAALKVLEALGSTTVAVNIAENHYGIETSSLATSAAAVNQGIEPIYQVLTRDRNRIALQSDILGAAGLGIKNILCLSGYHQTLTGCPQSANVYDIDSIQLVATVKQMRDEGILIDGTEIQGQLSMLIGAVANPFMQPMEMNILRLAKKIAAGADFVQTQAVFDVEGFKAWIDAANADGLCEKTAIIVGVMPLVSADQARKLVETFTDFVIPESIIDRLDSAGDAAAQKAEGIAICSEIAKELKQIKGVRGVHILSGANETVVPDVIAASGL